MAHKELLFALALIAASPVSATGTEPVPAEPPAGTPETQYCMRV